MVLFNIKNYDQLTENDRAILQYMGSNLDKVQYMRVRDIAKNAHVSNSSVMRFIHRIGYSSFPEFKIKVAEIDKDKNILNTTNHFYNESDFDVDLMFTLRKVVSKIQDADNIFFIGMGESGAMAEYAARKLSSIGYNCSVIKDPFYPVDKRIENTVNNVIFFSWFLEILEKL